jgi:deoxycytidylate deaminase
LVEHTKKNKRIRSLEFVPIFIVEKFNENIEEIINYCTKELKLVDPIILLSKIKIKLPTETESMMAMAYVNSMRSSCLKRKVGAIIVDKSGNVFSSGYNEVPPFEESCYGCYGECYRNFTKRKVSELFGDDHEHKEKVMGELKFLEKCRALHAEENAILNIAKSGNSSLVKEATLYTTTYPCNLCANKISKINIKKIIYYEPYPVEEAKNTLNRARVDQEMFEGITYNSYFKVYNDIIL